MPGALPLHLLTQYYFIVTCPVSKLPLWPPHCLCTRAGLLIVTPCRCTRGDSRRGGIDESKLLPCQQQLGKGSHSTAQRQKKADAASGASSFWCPTVGPGTRPPCLLGNQRRLFTQQLCCSCLGRLREMQKRGENGQRICI